MSDSSTQQTPKSTKQKFSQKTPQKHHHLAIQVRPLSHTVASQAIPSTNHKGCSTDIQANMVKDKSTQLNFPPMDIKLSKHSDTDIKMYTGFSTYALFSIVFNYVRANCDEEDCTVDLHKADPQVVFPGIDAENQFFLVLYKLWQNPTDVKIAEEFGISDASVSRLFHFWNERMFRKFKILNLCPSLEKLQQYMTDMVNENSPICGKYMMVQKLSAKSHQILSHKDRCGQTISMTILLKFK